jgi:hypothetical protein
MFKAKSPQTAQSFVRELDEFHSCVFGGTQIEHFDHFVSCDCACGLFLLNSLSPLALHMDHIINSQTEGIDWTRYSAYVEAIRQKLPAHVYSFASDPRYFDLSSHSSLHDAWLESLSVREVSIGKRSESRRMEITISLLGPFHDRRIHLQYTGVTRYSFAAPPRYGEPRYHHTAHGDLFTHEVRLGPEGLFVHELLFERDATFLIECSDIRHSEERISDENLTKHLL